MTSIFVPPIEESLSPDASYERVEERYYEKFQCNPENTPKMKETGAQSLLLHSNRICLVTLAPEHPVIKEDLIIERIHFQVSDKLNRLDNDVRGKGKKGGQTVDEGAILAWIECQNDRKFCVRSNVRGKLLEVNEQLISNPNLVKTKTFSQGHVAIVLPKIPDGVKHIREMFKKVE